tara:strand:+ start:306 stop:563 length:258 start_codon:yes stop_codon:yes gene_type:complete
LHGVRNGLEEGSKMAIPESAKKALREKAKSSGYSYEKLAAVYRRGQGAYVSSGSRNVSMAAWAMGRVNSFIKGGHSQDDDLKGKR